MNPEPSPARNELNLHYQKCFVGYSPHANWSPDLKSALEEALPKSQLEPLYEDAVYDTTKPLQKAIAETISRTSYGIYDLSYWKKDKNEWVMPANVFIELGMSIALNRPIFLLQRTESRKSGSPLPECLEGIRDRIFEYTGKSSLTNILETRLPQLLEGVAERDWHNNRCLFGERDCEYRTIHPSVKQPGQLKLLCLIADGPDDDKYDFRAVVEDQLERFGALTYCYLDELSIPRGYNFLFCAYCQTIRSSQFAIYRITPQTPAETYIAIGISIALEEQFHLKIPRIVLTGEAQNIPSLLQGFRFGESRNDGELKRHLQKFLPEVIQIAKETAWKVRPLPYIKQEKPRSASWDIQPGQIDNSYVAGMALRPGNSLFVGRRSQIQQIETALQTDRRPILFLAGERRMGRTSLLLQLPFILGPRFVPVYFDLQNPGMLSSTSTFLATIADTISRAMELRGIKIKDIKPEQLQKAAQKNDAGTYYAFDVWLKSVEDILKQNNITLLLIFDEYEHLERAVDRGLDLNLLLDWFRSIIQSYPRIGLLFSGARNFDEMGTLTNIDWSSYFVNLQIIKVSFLTQDEARQLINHPIPTFPGDQIFPPEVVDEIIRLTGGHPFLIQALCSTLIDQLNSEKRVRVEIQDMEKATNRLLEMWGDGFFRYLWNTTSEEQHRCLASIINPANGSCSDNAMKELSARDLVVYENGAYRISIPLFQEWVLRSVNA
jgi:AAA-like domain